jgi:hypothetical protein
MANVIIGAPSTTANWTATCQDDQVNHCGPRQGVEDNDLRGRGHALYHRLTAMRRSSKRPIIEKLPYIRIGDIASLFPRNNPNLTCNPDAYSWRYPGKVMLSMNGIKLTDAAIAPNPLGLHGSRQAQASKGR